MLGTLCWLATWMIGLCMILLALAILFVKYIYFGQPVYYQGNASMEGKTVIITGANSGIGKETSIDLARRGARVIMACRSELRARPVVEEVKSKSGNEDVVFEHLDLADLESVRGFADRIKKQEPHIDVLINNAGMAFNQGKKTKDGFDLVYCSNYLGHFLLTELLLGLLQKSAPSRIINVSSILHKYVKGLDFTKYDGKYKRLSQYDRSKLAQILHVRELAVRLQGTGVTTYSLNPGPIMTGIWMNMESMYPSWLCTILRHVFKFIFWDAEAGAQTTIYVAVDGALHNISGKYYEKCAIQSESSYARNDEMAKKLDQVSREMVGLVQC